VHRHKKLDQTGSYLVRPWKPNIESRSLLAACIAVLFIVCASLGVRSVASVSLAPTVIVRMDTRAAGRYFEAGAIGLSVEASELGSDRLSADHHRLVRLMRLLGPSVLRVGGNSVDLSWWTSHKESPPSWATNIVTPSDIAVLGELMKVTHWHVLLGVDLGHFEPQRVADEVRYARVMLGSSLLGVEIGNEPNKFSEREVDLRAKGYDIGEYLNEVETYKKVLTAAVPGTPILGPATGGTVWITQMGSAAQTFAGLTIHFYPSTFCPSVSEALSSEHLTDELLSPKVRIQENEVLHVLAQSGLLTGRPVRIGETNSNSCTAAIPSPVFASALWSLDWALRAASSGVSSLQFHDGLHVCAHLESPICTTGSQEAANAGDVTARPEYYGLLAARQLEGGQFIPTQIVARHPLTSLTTWATISRKHIIKLAIDNFNPGGLTQPILVSLPGYRVTKLETLAAPSADASEGITLGSASVTRIGEWRPRPVVLNHSARMTLMVSPASAIIVTMRLKS
jgi:hypothetical protein